MLAMANMNPERRKAGRNVATMATWLARSWFFSTVLMRMPIDRAPTRNIAPMANNRATLPRSGTPKTNSPISTANSTSTMPITK